MRRSITKQATVIPKIPVYFAEFPKVDSPEHRRLLSEGHLFPDLGEELIYILFNSIASQLLHRNLYLHLRLSVLGTDI